MNQPQPQVGLLLGKIHWMSRRSTAGCVCVVVEGWQTILPWVSRYSEVWAFASALQTGAFFFLLLRAFAAVQIVFWRKNIQGLSPVLIFIFLLISSYISRTKNFSNVLIFFWQSYFPTRLISKYEFKKWFT